MEKIKLENNKTFKRVMMFWPFYGALISLALLYDGHGPLVLAIFTFFCVFSVILILGLLGQYFMTEKIPSSMFYILAILMPPSVFFFLTRGSTPYTIFFKSFIHICITGLLSISAVIAFWPFYILAVIYSCIYVNNKRGEAQRKEAAKLQGDMLVEALKRNGF